MKNMYCLLLITSMCKESCQGDLKAERGTHSSIQQKQTNKQKKKFFNPINKVSSNTVVQKSGKQSWQGLGKTQGQNSQTDQTQKANRQGRQESMNTRVTKIIWRGTGIRAVFKYTCTGHR